MNNGNGNPFLSVHHLAWLTDVQRLATAVHVMAGFSDYTFEIFTMQPTALMSRRVASRKSPGSRQQGHKSSHGTHWEAAESLTWPVCTAPCVLKDHVQSTLEAAGLHCCNSKKISPHKRQTDYKEVSVRSPASKLNLSVFPFLMHLVMASNPLHTFLLRITGTWAGCTLFWTAYLICHTVRCYGLLYGHKN